MTYKGRYTVKNPQKYEGDPTKVVFRSMWERQVFKFMDTNPDVIKWQSEETVIPYRCKTDNKIHRYFMDVKMVTGNDIHKKHLKVGNCKRILFRSWLGVSDLE